MIEEDVQRRQEEGRDVARRLPQVGESVRGQLQEVTLSWGSLQAKASQRRERLRQAEAVQRYLADWRQLSYVHLSVSLHVSKPHTQRSKPHTQRSKRHTQRLLLRSACWRMR